MSARDPAAQIRGTPWFQRNAQAFTRATGLQVHLVSPMLLTRHPARWDGLQPFCRELHRLIGGTPSCRRRLVELAQGAVGDAEPAPATICCPAGLTITAIPIRLSSLGVVLVVSGRVLVEAGGGNGRGATAFRRRLRRLVPGADAAEVARLAELAPRYKAPVYEADVQLLELIGSHLAMFADRLLAAGRQHERQSVQRARELIDARFAERLTLAEAAKRAGISAHYFSRIFHRETGKTFSAYLAALRVATFKRHLSNPDITVARAAFDAGFQSVSQANRVFRQATGLCPKKFREKLGK